MKTKPEEYINRRNWIIVGSVFVLSLVLIYRLAMIQFVEGNRYRELANRYTIRTFKVPASRGNIYSSDGKLLAVSAPLYTVHFDPVTVSKAEFDKNLRPLAKGLASITGKPASYWVRKFREARRKGNRYVLVARDLTYEQFDRMRKLPVFRKGRYKGGFLFEYESERRYPYGEMLKRTIGRSTGSLKYGLEGTHDKELRGIDGERLKQRLNSTQWKPVNDFNEREPEDGSDLVTTIDIQMQEIAHNALLDQLKKYKADHGTLVLMDVQTGAVKALVNLQRTKGGTYRETRNFAVFERFEPGSLFKTFTYLTWFSAGKTDTSDVYPLEGNRWKYYDRYIRDAHRHKADRMKVSTAFAVSSNVMTAKLTDRFFRDRPSEFTDRLTGDLGLSRKTGIDITGEREPLIPRPGDKNWKPYKLGMMSFGYGVEMTPLQILALYNGIANGGKVMRPYLVEEIRRKDRTVKKIKPRVLTKAMASPQDIGKIKALMRKVVTEGTARNVNSPYVEIAGKTGTTQTEYWTDDIQYIASFAGFFPYSSPRYSMIVVVHKPDKRIGYYGNEVAGTVFREVAEQINGLTPVRVALKVTQKQ
ncbi:MAG: penicillin-binding protein 2 [Chlorobi bacterium]|nr:penicillin-binding protein 2 [Chlorobiota bacterium]